MKNARDRTGAAALVGAAVTGLIAFALFLAGGLLLWANGHYKDADGYLSHRQPALHLQRVRDHDAQPRGRTPARPAS